jgi:hypothetical protein
VTEDVKFLLLKPRRCLQRRAIVYSRSEAARVIVPPRRKSFQETLGMDKDDLRELIKDFKRMNAKKPIPQMHWVISHIQAYIDGDYATLDEALGLIE